MEREKEKRAFARAFDLILSDKQIKEIEKE